MTAAHTNFALIGRSFPSDAFQDLYTASVSLRAQRRQHVSMRAMREARVWQASGEPIIVPDRLRV